MTLWECAILGKHSFNPSQLIETLGSWLKNNSKQLEIPMELMKSVYFETRFRMERFVADLPQEFVILSAYATTGEKWVYK